MRCKCCDRVLNDHELLAKNPYTGEPEDLCRKCLNALRAQETYDDEGLPEIWPEKRLDNISDMW